VSDAKAAAKPTATLRVEWRTDKMQTVKVITAVDQNGRAVALKALNVTQDPAPETNPERKLRDYARKVAMQAELTTTYEKHLAKVRTWRLLGRLSHA
jgi:hypothetical protein